MAIETRIIQILTIVTIVLNQGVAEISVIPVSYLYDRSGLETSKTINGQFISYSGNEQIPVTKGSKTWFDLRVSDFKPEGFSYLYTNVHLNEDLLSQIELFSNDGEFLGKFGDWLPREHLTVPENRMVLKLPLQEGFQSNYILCISALTKGNIRPLKVTLLNQAEVELIPVIHKGKYSQMLTITYGVFWGVIIISIILVSFQYSHYRERSYGYYLLYLIFLSFLYFRGLSNPFNGLLTIHGIYGRSLYASETGIQYLTFGFYIYFVYYFLDLHRNKSSRLRMTFIYCANFFLILAAIDIPIQNIFGIEVSRIFFNYIRLLFFPLPLILIFTLWKQNKSLFIYILLFGTILVALPSFFTAFSNWGEGIIGYKIQDSIIRQFRFYNSNLVIPMYHTRIGICLEILCFTIALGYKNQWNVKQLKRKTYSPLKPLPDPVVTRLQSLVLSNLDQDFDLDKICENLRLSRSKLHERVKAATGKSTSIFVRSLRLEEARKLLFTTRLTIAEIAYQVGFKDPNYFTRTFTQEFGVSPKRMREEKED